MKTIIKHIDPDNIDISVMEEAGRIIRRGGIVAFPTETVYGLGGDALNSDSSARIYEAKGRPSDNPLIVHIADISDLDRIVTDVPDEARLLADRFWPGPLTMILNKADIVPFKTTGGLSTVAVRFPSDPVAQAFIKGSGGYIAAPSANISGRPSPTRAEYVIQDMDGRVDMILAGDDSLIGLESTIVDLTVRPAMILRPGFITREELAEVIPDVCMDPAFHQESPDTLLHPKAPGMKYRHYAPKGSLEIICRDDVSDGSGKESIISYINERLEQDRSKGLKTGVICADERSDRYAADVVCSTGSESATGEAAHRLFAILRHMDDEDVQSIYAEGIAEDGIGIAYMNRLRKAAGGNIIYL